MRVETHVEMKYCVCVGGWGGCFVYKNNLLLLFIFPGKIYFLMRNTSYDFEYVSVCVCVDMPLVHVKMFLRACMLVLENLWVSAYTCTERWRTYLLTLRLL